MKRKWEVLNVVCFFFYEVCMVFVESKYLYILFLCVVDCLWLFVVVCVCLLVMRVLLMVFFFLIGDGEGKWSYGVCFILLCMSGWWVWFDMKWVLGVYWNIFLKCIYISDIWRWNIFFLLECVIIFRIWWWWGWLCIFIEKMIMLWEWKV